MMENNSEMARKIAEAVRTVELQQEGFAPNSITVILCNQTLTITLDAALTSIEQSLLQSEGGSARVQEYHEQLFSKPPYTLWEQIKKVTGASGAECGDSDSKPCCCVKVFPNGTVVHVFALPQAVPTSVWSGSLAREAVGAA